MPLGEKAICGRRMLHETQCMQRREAMQEKEGDLSTCLHALLGDRQLVTVSTQDILDHRRNSAGATSEEGQVLFCILQASAHAYIIHAVYWRLVQVALCHGIRQLRLCDAGEIVDFAEVV